jgi:hypothetical protein
MLVRPLGDELLEPGVPLGLPGDRLGLLLDRPGNCSRPVLDYGLQRGERVPERSVLDGVLDLDCRNYA